MKRTAKQTKSSSTKLKTAEVAFETTSDIAASIFSESLIAIREEIRGIVAGKITPEEHDPASRIAWLAQKAASVASEQRKAEAAENAAAKRLTAAQILLWFRQQTAEYRLIIVRQVTGLDATEKASVLG